MYLTALKLQARAAARRAGFSAAGALCLAVGLGFLTAAGFLAIEASQGALVAALVIAVAYLGLGLVFLGLSMRRTIRVPVGTPLAAAGGPRLYSYAVPALIEAFMVGVAAGIANRPRGRRPD